MLYEFIIENRDEILRRTRAKVSARMAPAPTSSELDLGVPLFLDQLAATLEHGVDHSDQIDRDATRHGERRHQMGFTVAQVVEDYGDLCQVVTQLAIDRKAPIGTDDFRTLNRCLDDAIAQSVTEFARVRDRAVSAEEFERLGFFAHELRNHLQTASLAFEILKTGTVSIGGSTGAVLDRSLSGLRSLVDRTLAQVRLDDGVDHGELVPVAEFLEEVEAAGSIAARNRGVSLSVGRVEARFAVHADRQLLGSAVSNLVQNAIKFTHPKGRVIVRTSTSADQVTIEVEDQCGGLRPGQLESIFEGPTRSLREGAGLGLGLLISKRAVESMGGTLEVSDRAGIGCVFTIRLPLARAV